MADRSAPPAGAPSLPVILCCARGEGDALGEVVGALEQRGHAVELIEGVELDPRALAVAIERRQGNGFYVLCRAGALDRDKIDALREVLLAQRVPFGRTLTVSGTKASDLIDRIDQSLRRQVVHGGGARTTAPRPDPAETPVRPRRATIMVTAPSPAPRPSSPSPQPATPKPASPSPSALPSPRATLATRAPAPPPPAPSAVPPRAATPSAANEETHAEPAPPSSTPTLRGSDAPVDDLAGPEDQTRAFTASEDIGPGAAMVGEFESVVAREPEPETSLTMELEDLIVDEPSSPPRPRIPLGVDDDIPTGVDLAGVLDGLGADAIDRTMPAIRPNTVVARSDTVVARSDTVVARAPAPERHVDEIELSLRDGVIVDGYDKVDVTQVARAPAPPPPPMPRHVPQASTVVASAVPVDDGSRWRFIAAAVVAAAGIGILAAVIVSRKDDDAKPLAAAEGSAGTDAQGSASKPDAKVDDAKADDTKADDAKADDAKVDDAKADDAKADDAKAAAKADAKADAKAPTKTPSDPKTKVDPPTKLAAASTAKDPSTRATAITAVTRKREVPLPPARTLVLRALRARTIRALDVLLVTRRATSPMPQSAAAGHCEKLELDGLSRWRLPEIGELSSLTEAGIIGRGFYWSSTSADTFGDMRMAWNGGTRSGGVRYKNAAVVCVRGDRGEGA